MAAWAARQQIRKPDLTRLAASKLVETHGRTALKILAERAELAEELGHKLAAETWRSMLDAAAGVLGTALPRRHHSGMPATALRADHPTRQ